MNELSPVDAAFIPRFRDDVAVIPVADEAIIYEQETGALHQLDVLATTVCHLLDGSTSVAVASEELAAMFAAERERVEADVLALVRDLARRGLFTPLPAVDRQAGSRPGEGR